MANVNAKAAAGAGRDSLAAAARDKTKVSESPHDIYRYPARFSPIFVRKAIQVFTDLGDTVFDPFCGGGTTVVEALRMGRRAIGMDVSSLAAFVTKAKTTPLSKHDKVAIGRWSESLQLRRDKRFPSEEMSPLDSYYGRNLPPEAEKFFTSMIGRISQLNVRQANFVRLILLATGQWALDCNLTTPSEPEMLRFFQEKLASSLARFADFVRDVAENNHISPSALASLRRVICASSEQCGDDRRIPRAWQPVRLVLTSPPYPGVHVLYHRWQVFGRRETPVPFWIVNQKDGAGEAHYTLGRRDEAMLERYYSRLRTIFGSIRQLVAPQSHVVQLIAFSNAAWQLPAYLEAMTAAGFEEVAPPGITQGDSERVWRDVPGRKWYAAQQQNSASRELLLVHRPTRVKREHSLSAHSASGF